MKISVLKVKIRNGRQLYAEVPLQMDNIQYVSRQIAVV